MSNTEFQINTYTTSGQNDPSITNLSDGGFVVTWHSDGQDGSGYGAFGQRFDATGIWSGASVQRTTNLHLYQPTLC